MKMDAVLEWRFTCPVCRYSRVTPVQAVRTAGSGGVIAPTMDCPACTGTSKSWPPNRPKDDDDDGLGG